MDILVRKSNNECVTHGKISIKEDRDMYFIDEQKAHIQYLDLYTLVTGVTLPADYKDKKYKYDSKLGFQLNPDYIEPISVEEYVQQNRSRIESLETGHGLSESKLTSLEEKVNTTASELETLKSSTDISKT